MVSRSVPDRPSPDALLEQAGKDGRGRLKIFLGAAPGVGKTFEMLTQGRRRRLDGTDVVIGVVETHGRIETEILTEGIETIPRKRLVYKDKIFTEMDLDGLLQRRPKLALVDELAHSNAAGSRHPKRYQDVEELLAAGIDVYSTVNIQHIESLNDVVAQITRIRVRETIPDRVLDATDEIEIVDTTADDLLQRLREGKVYVKAQAERALRHFFSPGNLIALRELALRKAAQHVDRAMVDFMQAHAIGGPWPAGEHVLVCVNEHPASAELVRRGRRLANDLRATLTVLYVEGSRHLSLGEFDKDRIAETLRLAQHLGAEPVTLPGRNIADTVLDFARTKNVTHILTGKSARSRWFELLHGSVMRDLMRNSGAISVTAVLAAGEPVMPKAVKTAPRDGGRVWPHYGLSLIAAALTTAVAVLFNAVASQALGSIGMLFLVPVLASGVWFGLRPALFTALVSLAAYNFFLLPPIYRFTIADPNNWLSFGVLLLVAVIAANLAARVRAQADLAARRAAIAAELFSFTGKIAGVTRLEDILWAAAFQIASMLKSQVVILLPNRATRQLEICGAYPPEDELTRDDIAAATWCWEKNKVAGHNADTLPGVGHLFLPMRSAAGPIGVLGLQRADAVRLFTPEESRLLDALNDQTALAIERAQLAARVDEAQVRAEADKLRIAMLTSLSHDLRTPLASILGAVTTLLTNLGLYDRARTEELLTTAREETERLDRFVGNLLDMSRLEAGALGVDLQPTDIGEIVELAVTRLARRLAGHRLRTELADDLPFVSADPVLLEQALVNVLDNAAKYAPAGSEIHIFGEGSAGQVLLAIADEGPGIPESDLENIFDKFYRARKADYGIAGTGLGLSVALGFVEASGGSLTAANRRDRSGVVFRIALPVDDGEAAAGAG